MTAALLARTLLGAALATLGFAVAVNLPYRALPIALLVGMAGALSNGALIGVGSSAEFAAFGGGLVVGLLAEGAARRFHHPVTLFTITGFIPLVPGTLAFRAVQALLDGAYVEGLIFALRAVLIGGAIAAGIGLASIFTVQRRSLLRQGRG